MTNGEGVKEVEENGHKYRGTLEYNKIKESEMRENIWREYLRRTKLIMNSALNGSNKNMAFFLMRYVTGILKLTKSELDEINRKTRKVMTMNK